LTNEISSCYSEIAIQHGGAFLRSAAFVLHFVQGAVDLTVFDGFSIELSRGFFGVIKGSGEGDEGKRGVDGRREDTSSEGG
jgi:hypothetical protein